VCVHRFTHPLRLATFSQTIPNHRTPPIPRFRPDLFFDHTASQSDLASLRGENIDYKNRFIGYMRKKTGSVAQIHFGIEVAAILATLPMEGLLFPYLHRVRAGDRATEFKQRCRGLGIHGVSLHSYRYAGPSGRVIPWQAVPIGDSWSLYLLAYFIQ
jgi:hypothetical protein